MSRGANQPSSTSSNHNQSKDATKRRSSKKNKKSRTYRSNKKTDKAQAAMINKLSRQVYKLQMASYGKTQQNFHSLTKSLIPTNTKPLCFDLTDFTCVRGPLTAGTPDRRRYGGHVYQHNGAVPQDRVSNWERNAVVLDNPYWKQQNFDQPDTSAYLCMNCTYMVDIQTFGGAANAQGVVLNSGIDNARIRFDIIGQKPEGVLLNPGSATGLIESSTLPDTLGHMKHLCEPYLNRINPSYFTKYFSKVLYFNSTKSGTLKGTTANKMRFSFKLKPNKLCTQNQFNPQVGGAIVQYDDVLQIGQQIEIDGGNFGPLNVNPIQPLWCVISTDWIHDNSSPTRQPYFSVNISRRVVWKDQIGNSNM